MSGIRTPSYPPKARRIAASAATCALLMAGLVAVAPAHADSPTPLASVTSAIASDGTPDADFSAATGSGFNSDVYSVALQTDGKVVVGGAFTAGIARLNQDGTRDTEFNSAIGSGVDGEVWSVALQSDGKILVGGIFTSLNGNLANSIARLNADGTRDTDFETAIGITEGTTVRKGTVTAFVIQPDLKILVGGFFDNVNGSTAKGLARINVQDGSLDTSFTDNSGTLLDALVWTVAVQPNGQIVVGSVISNFNSIPSRGIARLNADGTMDPDFALHIGTGLRGDKALDGIAGAYTVAIQADGGILIGGFFNSLNDVPAIGIARLDPNGFPDTGFGMPKGLDFGVDPTVGIYALAVQPDGKVIVGGSFTALNGSAASKVVRLDNVGTRDASFDTPVEVTFNEYVNAVAMQPDGDLVVVGGFTEVDGITSNRIARLTHAAPRLTTIAPAFGADGGGTSVTITGSRLSGASAVTFGGVDATALVVDSGTQITATTPSHAAGVVDVVVTTAGGSTTMAGAYSYSGAAPPAPPAPVAAPTLAPTAADAATPTPTATPQPAPHATPIPSTEPLVIPTPSAVSPAEMTGWTPEQVSTIDPTDFGQVPPEVIGAISPAQAAAMSPEQFSNIRPLGAAELLPATVSAMGPTQLAGMRPAAVGALNPLVICAPVHQTCVLGENGLTAAQLAAFRPSAFAQLQLDQFTVIRPAQVADMSSAAMNQIRAAGAGALQPRTVAAFEPEQLGAMRPTAVGALAPAAIALLTPEQLAAFRPEGIARLSGPAVAQIRPLALAGMSVAQLRALTTAQVSALTHRQLAALSPAQHRLL